MYALYVFGVRWLLQHACVVTCMPYMYALYVCLICMPYMYALYVCLICMPYMYLVSDDSFSTPVLWHVCLICMPYMYALYVCLICMPYMYALYVCLICMHKGPCQHACVVMRCIRIVCLICMPYMYALYVCLIGDEVYQDCMGFKYLVCVCDMYTQILNKSNLTYKNMKTKTLKADP
jgi:hypothetical protein